jgi:hypothetical protein
VDRDEVLHHEHAFDKRHCRLIEKDVTIYTTKWYETKDERSPSSVDEICMNERDTCAELNCKYAVKNEGINPF